MNTDRIREELELDVMVTLEYDGRPQRKNKRAATKKTKQAILISDAGKKSQNFISSNNPNAYDEGSHAAFEKSLMGDPALIPDINKRKYFKLDNSVYFKRNLQNATSATYDPDVHEMYGETDMKNFDLQKDIDNWEITHDIEGYNFGNAITVQDLDRENSKKLGMTNTSRAEVFESSKYQSERLSLSY